MQLPADVTDQLVGYDIEKIIAVTVAQAGCCEHGVPLLAPCAPCRRVDVFAQMEDERDGSP